MGDTENSEAIFTQQNKDVSSYAIEVAPQPESPFPDLVSRSQELWRQKWEIIKKESTLSEIEANEISPKTSERLFSMVTDSLPSYIPQEVRKYIVEKHPTPLYNVAFLVDPRRERALHDQSDIDFEFSAPPEVSEKDMESYFRGLIALNEIATDKVTEDIVNYQITAASTDAGISMTEKRRKIIRGFSREMQDILSGYKLYRQKVLERLGDKTTFSEFKTSIAQAMMTGDNNSIDAFLKDKGFGGLSGFAIELGSSLSRDQNAQQMEQRKSHLGIIASSFLRGGITYRAYPGVIGINAAPFPANISYGWIHETVHYLSTNENHSGLFKIRYYEKANEKTPQGLPIIEGLSQ